MTVHLRGQSPARLARTWPDVLPDVTLARRVVARLVGEDRDDLGEVRGLSKLRAAALLERGAVDRLQVVDRRSSEVDGFAKYLFRAADGATFEAVRIPLQAPRYSACVSSQAGCALACAFCETGRLGLVRSLEAWEIVEQVLTVRREALDRPVTGVVFQGQGEPFQNYDDVMAAADVLRDPCGGRIGSDRMTISTVGIAPMIDRYTDEGHPYRLILSLTSAIQERREVLVPVAKRWPLGDLAEAMKRHARARRRAVNLAWVLMSGVNTGDEEAEALARLFEGVAVRVHVIDVNDPTGEYGRAGDEERSGFLGSLARRGIPFVRRYSGGSEIHAACGMLASSARGGSSRRASAETLA